MIVITFTCEAALNPHIPKSKIVAAIVECEKLGNQEPSTPNLPESRTDIEKINSSTTHKVTFDAIDRALSSLQQDITNIREQLDTLRRAKK